MQEVLIDARRRAARLAACACLGAALSSPVATAAPQAAREAANRMSARALVAAASVRAAVKLRSLQCLELLSDFQDSGGKRLSAILEERHMDAHEFFASLFFVDGRATPLCASGTAAAGANPGSIFIGVCKETFSRVQAEDPGFAANVLIHEMLHALGLGENPPTSEEITRQVARRCGR